VSQIYETKSQQIKQDIKKAKAAAAAAAKVAATT
jgi:hypothetical protein